MSAAPPAPAAGALQGSELSLGETVTDTGTDSDFAVVYKVADDIVPCLFNETGRDTDPHAQLDAASGSLRPGVAAGT